MSLSEASPSRRPAISLTRLMVALTLVVGMLGAALGVIEATPAGAAGSPTQLAFTTSPTTVAAGSAMTAPVVQLRDSGNNNVLQSGTSVSLAIATGPGTFDPSAITTVITNSSGQAIFSNLVFQTVGSYTITASSTGLTSKTSGAFSVTVGPLNHISLSNVPATVVSGASLGITATAQDVYGNTETGNSTGVVTLAVATGPAGGAIAGTPTRTLVSGVATFSAPSLTLVGNYTLTASLSGVATVTTGTIAVTAGAAKKLGFTQQPSAVVAGAVMSPAPTVQVEDTNGNAVVDPGVSVTLSSTGTLTAGSTKVVSTDSNGVATFSNLTWNTAGSYTVSAAATSLTSATSNSFAVAAGSATTLVFSTQPANTSAGSTMATTVVKVEDALGNVLTNSSDVVTLVPNGAGGFDPAATASATAVNGVATFSDLILDRSGSYTLSASSPDGAVGTSKSFTISPLAATQLVFSQAPISITAGTVQTPNVVVQAQDQFGNVATSATGTVTLTASPSVTLTAGTRALSSGVATFSSLNIQTAGSYTLTASLSGLTSATSGSFTIAPNVAYQLVFGTQPTSITAGQTISPSPTVLIEDHFGNVETADNSDTVTVAGSLAAGSTATVTVTAGVATFSNLTIDVVGNATHTLTATSSITPAIRSGTSASFTVSPGAPSSFLIAQPQLGGQVNTGNSIGTFYLEQLDQYGNNTWGTSGTPLTFSSSSPGGTFSLTDGGPSTTTASFPYPPNSNNPPTNRYLFFYYGDTDVGLPTITVSSPGVTSGTQQVEVINVESPGNQTSDTGSAIAPLTLTGQNSSPAYPFTGWAASGLPAGLSIDTTTGIISGTPTTTGTSTVEIIGYEGLYAYGYNSFTWTIANAVSVTSPGDQSAVSGAAIAPLAISATDSGSASLSYSDGGTLPPGLVIDAGTGSITGTPTTAGTYPVTITATDSSGFSGSASFTWTVTNNVSVANPGDQSNLSGSAILALAISATDSGSASLAYSDGGTLPPGLVIDAATGSITGTPTTAGTFPVTITVTDSSGFTGATTFAWVISNAISVTNPGDQSSTSGAAISALQIEASDTSSASLSYSDGGTLPAGLSINAGTGSITGTPTTAGTYPVTITVTDSASYSAQATFSWTVTNTVSVTSPGNQSSASGTAITPLPIVASDSGGSALTYSATGLPAGLSINAGTGTISGTPTTAGSNSVTVTATDNSGATGSATFSWTVTNTVSVTSPGNQSSASGTAITPLPIVASDSGGSALTYSATGLPAGLSINAGTGTISGTPTTAGSNSVTVTATDNSGATGSATFSWTVTNTVSVTSPGNQSSASGTAITPLPIVASDSGGSALTYSATGLPAGLSINAGTGTISGTPTTAGSNSVTVTATDNSGATGSATFSWTVTGSATSPTITLLNHTSGRAAGGVKVKITGTHLNGATKVYFGSVAATAFRWNRKGTRILATTPAEASGTVDVTVVTPQGTSSLSASDRYTFVGPTIVSVTPNAGPVAGGTKVKIKGSTFSEATQVSFGSMAATTFKVTDDGKSITVTAPAHAMGTVDITVTSPSGTSAVTGSDRFTFG